MKDITDRLERLEVFEDRFGVNFKGLYCKVDDDNDINLNGEIHAIDTELQENIAIVVVCYDEQDRVLYTTSACFTKEDFFGFDVFDFSIYNLEKIPSKIRIFPKKY